MPITDIYRPITTPAAIIKRALRLLGVLASGESLEASMLEDGRETLNDMLDAWNIEKLMIPVLSKNTFPLTASHNPHTIGYAGELDAARPNRIEQGQAFLTGGTLGTNEIELTVITQENYADILDKSQSALPGSLYYETAMPLGKIYLDPKPDTGYTLILYLEQLFAQIASSGTSTEFVLAPGYKEAIVHNLAIQLSAEYPGRQVPATVIATAISTKASLKRLNQRPLTLRGDPALRGENQNNSGFIDSRAFLTGGY